MNRHTNLQQQGARTAILGEFSLVDDGQVADAAGRRRLLSGGIALLGLLFLLSLVIPIGTAVLGQGELVSEGRTKRIAHPVGGVIAEILVRNGDTVRDGDLLLRLEDDVSGAAASYSTMTVEQLIAQRARLDAERMGRSAVSFPDELTSAGTASAREAIAGERELFRIRAQEHRQMQAQLQSRSAQAQQQIASYEAQISAFQRQQELIEPELAGVRDLWQQELVTIDRLNQLERTQASLDGTIASLRADIARTRASINETRQAAIQLDRSRRAEAAAQLARLDTVLNEQRTRAVSAADRQDNTEIRAPYSGTVEKMAYNAIGDVITAGDPILEIVPDGEAMIVEASISPADVDRVVVGQEARVRLVAFSLSSTPELDGKVTYVASDRLTDPEAGVGFYVVQIELDDQQALAGLPLRSGMPAEVVITTGSRSMMSFLTKPLRDQFERAFRYE